MIAITRTKNKETRIVFPLLDADNTPIPAATGRDSEITQFSDGANPGAFVDCTNESVEIGSGVYYLILTAAEMNSDYVLLQIKSSSAKTQHVFINTTMANVVWDEVLTGATHNVVNSAGRKLREVDSPVILTGTSPGTGNTATRIKLDAAASSMDGAYDPAVIIISAGTGVGQSRQIFEYDGVNKYAYINRDWKTIPDATSEYTIIADSGDTHVNEGVAQGGSTNTITLNALAGANDDLYIDQVVYLVAGTGQDQARTITAYNGTTKVATVDKVWQVNPDSTTIYAVLPNYHNDKPVTDALAAIQGATFDTATDSLEAIRNRGDANWLTGAGLSGANPITITLVDDADDLVVEAAVEIWDILGHTFYEKRTTNSTGQTLHNLDDGTYRIKIHKAGYTFTEQLLVVSGTASVEYEGERVIITAPAAATACRVYEYAFMPDGLTPVADVKATAKIISLPEDSGSMLHTGEEITGIYDASTGMLYWDIVQGAQVLFNVPDFGIKVKKTIPASATARLSALV